MNERMSLADKMPEVKSQNPVPPIRRKSESYESMKSPVDRILFLQRTIGNQAVQRLMKSGTLQAKLRIGQPGDIYEQEADRVAEQVMRMPDVSSTKDTRVHQAKETGQTNVLRRYHNPVRRYHNPDSLLYKAENLKKRKFTCPPAPDSITNIEVLAEPGTLGWTKLDKSANLICGPKFDVDAKNKTCTIKPLPVNLSITSKFVKVESEAPSSQTMKLPECGKKDVPIFMTITKEISGLAQTAEKEHCEDLNLAFKQTLEPCAAALKKFAGKKVAGKNEDECMKALIAKLGFDPLDCTEEFITMSGKTGERDEKHWHDMDPVVISKSCDKIVIGNKKSATNKIGDSSVAPNKHIHTATKCGTTTQPSSKTAPSTPPSSKGTSKGKKLEK